MVSLPAKLGLALGSLWSLLLDLPRRLRIGKGGVQLPRTTVRYGDIFPSEAYWLPIGAGIFTLGIAVDTIGHRTVYKEILRGGAGLVHYIIIVCGVGSCVLLCAAYPTPSALALPALVLTILSFAYSFVDEAMHWRRYLTARSDVVEMWSHVFILIGHGLMMVGWWRWYAGGYQGVAQTLAALRGM